MTKAQIVDKEDLVKIIYYHLDNDLPLSLIDDYYELNYLQKNKLLSIAKGYSKQQDILGEIYDTMDISLEYLKIPHSIDDLSISAENQIELFKRLDEIDKEHIIKNLVATNDKISMVQRSIRKLKLEKYKDEIKLCRIYLKNNKEDILKGIFIKRGISPKKIDTIFEIYDEFIRLSLKKRELIKKRDELLEQRRNLIDCNPEYAKITDDLVRCNVSLVNKVIRDCFKNIPLPKEEAQALAFKGLGDAINRFDYKKGYKFSTYAFKAITTTIKRNFKSLMGITWYKYYMKNSIAYWHNELANLDNEQTLPLNPKELVESGLVDYGEKQIANLDKSIDVIYNYSDIYDLPDDSLIRTKGDMPVDQNDYDFIDQMENMEEIPVVDDNLEKSFYLPELKRILDEALSELTEKEKNILEWSFGIKDGQTHTLREVAKILSMAKESTRCDRIKALEKLRKSREKLLPFTSDFQIINPQLSRFCDDELVLAFMKLYDMKDTNTSYVYKSFIISNNHIKWDENEVYKNDLLLDAFIINIKLGKHSYSVSKILELFNTHMNKKETSYTDEELYSYYQIYDELKKRLEIKEQRELDKYTLNMLRDNPDNVVKLALNGKC